MYLGLAAAVQATVRARAQLAPLQALGRQSYVIYLSHFWILAVVVPSGCPAIAAWTVWRLP